MRVVAQASNHREIEAGGRVFRAKNGIFDLPERLANRAVKTEVGQKPALNGPTHSGFGFHCKHCNFMSYFRRCSKCGRMCARAE